MLKKIGLFSVLWSPSTSQVSPEHCTNAVTWILDFSMNRQKFFSKTDWVNWLVFFYLLFCLQIRMTEKTRRSMNTEGRFDYSLQHIEACCKKEWYATIIYIITVFLCGNVTFMAMCLECKASHNCQPENLTYHIYPTPQLGKHNNF